MHGSAAAAAAAAATTAPPPRPGHSRSSSASAASVVTARRASSLSNGGRNSIASMRPQSPSEASLIALRLPRDSGPHERRRSSVAVEPSYGTTAEGLDNINRWSRSTTSSTDSVAPPRKSRTSSGAALPALLGKAFSPKPVHASELAPSASPRKLSPLRAGSPRRNGASPTASPRKPPVRPPRPDASPALTALPPLHTTPSLTDPNDIESPATIPAVATPSTAQPYLQEYFAAANTSPRASDKTQQPIMARSQAAPPSAASSSRASPLDPIVEPARGARSSVMNEQTGEAAYRRYRPKTRTETDKKALLSRALQKANTAVLLDNAQNFESALDAYRDACDLLQQVMSRSSAPDDRRKLDSIRVTYSNRIDELRQMDALQAPPRTEEKSLPARPPSDSSSLASPGFASAKPDAAVSGLHSPVDLPSMHPQAAPDTYSSVREDETDVMSAAPTFFDDESASRPSTAETAAPAFVAELDSQNEVDQSQLTPELDSVSGETEVRGRAQNTEVPQLQPLVLQKPDNSKFLPRPLSPRRPSGLDVDASHERQIAPPRHELSASKPTRDMPAEPLYIREDSNVAMTWLDTIDESGGSSRSSSMHPGFSRRELVHRTAVPKSSLDIESDFDAAFDAAVEAAYDEGLEPDLDSERVIEPASYRQLAEPSDPIRSSEIHELWSPSMLGPAAVDPEEEEEERILDAITQDLAQTFDFDLSSKSALPRQSNSSGYSRSTWQSSLISDRTTAGTSLSTVAEDSAPPRLPATTFVAPTPFGVAHADAPTLAPPPPPPQSSLPRPPSQTSTVRNRRLTGNATHLKIETAKPESRARASTYHVGDSPFRELDGEMVFPDQLRLGESLGAQLEPTISEREHERVLKSPPSLNLLTSTSDASRPTTGRTATTTASDFQRSFDGAETDEQLSTRPSLFRKNKSALSLREHSFLLSPTDHSGPRLTTPMSSTFMQYGLKRPEPAAQTSQRANLPTMTTIAESGQVGKVDLFDTTISPAMALHSSLRSSQPGPMPSSLEPCPESILLRPFWLMRAILSTLTHPKGGFLSTRLFVPREAWQTQGVRLKSVDDKVANCDLLTAALGRLAGVDTYDADAVMHELQSFEEVMERVQAALTKKLGGDVGTHGLAGLFKDASPATATTAPFAGAYGDALAGAAAGPDKGKAKDGKGGGAFNSWRKLRSKSSGAPMNGGSAPAPHSLAGLMPSVPMTSSVSVDRRGGGGSVSGSRRGDARTFVFEGTNGDYMGSVARLFENAQVLDLIARQVEDPGLRGTSPTHVGLELSIRHAAEFFAFYVVRFVLADLGLLLDKFVKRGSEWVLA